MALIGLGATRISITPAAVGPVKAMIRSLDAAALKPRMQQWMERPPQDLRRAIGDWARRHKVVTG
jgi:phosphotransferase system enzyme I (PtsP)